MNRRIPNGTYGGVRGMNNLYSMKRHRRWLITVVLTMPYDTESKSRNADFVSIAAERQPATFSAAGAVAP